MYINPDPKELNKGTGVNSGVNNRVNSDDFVKVTPVKTTPVKNKEIKSEQKVEVKTVKQVVKEIKPVKPKKTESKPQQKTEAKPKDVKKEIKQSVKPIRKKETPTVKQEVKTVIPQENNKVSKLKLDQKQDVKLVIKQPTKEEKPKEQIIEPVFVGENGEPTQVETATPKPQPVQQVKKEPQQIKTDMAKPVQQTKAEVNQQQKTPVISEHAQNVIQNKVPKMNKTMAIKKYYKPKSKSLYINQTQYMKPKKPAVFKDYSVDIVDFKF